MNIKHKPVEDVELSDGISSHPRGRVRYILEMFRVSEEVTDEKYYESYGCKKSNELLTNTTNN